ncbi:DUF4097 family beta strand repeat-containing protein [Pseudalkalibacillus caeni]|uniref:DUF4097 domain-containing protein n=1 Tax=Exobacillus caeni TaxID=2574798 RepID=A0A5R9FCB4_9BACL|nr:DUF4097 domain-containing protein [Pseudalkalibacillus caeni]TLS38523.1 DUF4097 domain-containing protein [Pseudalkalibacillus caeni]
MNEERKMILKMIEDGKITADEGAKLLEALGTKEDVKSEQKSHAESFEQETKTADWSDQWSKAAKSSTTRVSNFVESLIQKIKDLDLDFNFGSYEVVHHTFHQSDVSLKKLDISLRNGEIVLKPWDQNEVKVECEANVYRVSSEEEAKEKFLNEASFRVYDDRFSFKIDRADIKATTTVYLPESDYDDVRLKTFNGDITGETIQANLFKTKAANGRITFKKLEARDIEIEAANGAILIEDGEGEICELETGNGAITIKGKFNEIDAQSLNGAIRATVTEPLSGKGEFKTLNGSINVILPKGMAVKGDLKSSIGSVTCDLEDMKVVREKKEMAQRALRFVTSDETSPSYMVEANSKAGGITVSHE